MGFEQATSGVRVMCSNPLTTALYLIILGSGDIETTGPSTHFDFGV